MAQVVFITSNASGNGKTLTTAITAIAAHQFFQQRVLVLDTLNAASQLLHKLFPQTTTELAAGLTLLPTTVADLPAQIAAQRANYDYIFIDAPTAAGLANADNVVTLTAADAFALRTEQRLRRQIAPLPIHYVGTIQTAIFDQLDTVMPPKDIPTAELFNLPLANLGGFTDQYRRDGIDIDDEADEFAWAYFADLFNELTQRIAYVTAHGDLTDFTYTPKFVDDMGITAAGYGLTF
ncbi:P-loop NTPase family protein [Loigolactobacillus jiayinensis]|mgnify:CR=1 FL=1|uniref:ParA family protein n=1 Tax=Loigolactobacillus jiayinensis TaxID=2486016 RepID=A0ABW1RGJ9_9LACO|nr:hypothetical protein [Loigolactobacillus jiayinensis]